MSAFNPISSSVCLYLIRCCLFLVFFFMVTITHFSEPNFLLILFIESVHTMLLCCQLIIIYQIHLEINHEQRKTVDYFLIGFVSESSLIYYVGGRCLYQIEFSLDSSTSNRDQCPFYHSSSIYILQKCFIYL